MVNSEYIEGLWHQLKQKITSIYGGIPGNQHLRDYLFESLWRSDCDRLRYEAKK